MEQFQQSIKNKDMNHCRSIIIASLRQEIISKSQFKEYLSEAFKVFGNDFFDKDDELNIKNDKKDLFASIKVNFSRKKIDQLLDILPNTDTLDEIHQQPQLKSSKPNKMMLILALVVIGIIIIVCIFMSYGGNHTANTNNQLSKVDNVKHNNISISQNIKG